LSFKDIFGAVAIGSLLSSVMLYFVLTAFHTLSTPAFSAPPQWRL